jgi:hypothetical protein
MKISAIWEDGGLGEPAAGRGQELPGPLQPRQISGRWSLVRLGRLLALIAVDDLCDPCSRTTLASKPSHSRALAVA